MLLTVREALVLVRVFWNLAVGHELLLRVWECRLPGGWWQILLRRSLPLPLLFGVSRVGAVRISLVMWLALWLRLAIPLGLISGERILPRLLPVLHLWLLRIRRVEILRTRPTSVTIQRILKLRRAGTW